MERASSRDDQWLAKLQASGYRLTRPLKVIVEILASTTRPLEVVEVFDLGRSRYPGLGLVTVYRALEKLEELGLVQRVHRSKGCRAYLRAVEGHEHLLICVRCGKIERFSGDDLSVLIERVAHESGFIIQDHWLQFHGLCSGCQ